MKDERATAPLRYQTIHRKLREAILSGTLAPGDRLPPVQELAGREGVTPSTIHRALKVLADEGLIRSHVGRGTFVTRPANDTASDHITDPGTSSGDSRLPAPAPRVPTPSVGQTRQLAELMARHVSPGTIAFTRGIGDPSMIEKGVLTRLTLATLARGENLFHDYGDPMGLPELRESIARMYRIRGIPVEADSILVTSGSQQALSLLALHAAETGMAALCETPCYAGIPTAFRTAGLAVHPLPRDGDGPDPDLTGQLLGRTGPSLVYLCPVLHNPTGTDLSPERRIPLRNAAARHGSLIVSDEVFMDLHAEGPTPESFLEAPGSNPSTVVLGSLSKSFISGLRVGWIAGDPDRIRSLGALKKTMDLGCPPLMQGIARAFLEDPEGYRLHRERVAAHYLARRDTTLAALESCMPPGVTWTRPRGGFQLWMTLPEGTSSLELYIRALDAGVSFLPGPLQDPSGGSVGNLRLCYGSLTDGDIREGIARLARAMEGLSGPAASIPGPFGDF